MNGIPGTVGTVGVAAVLVVEVEFAPPPEGAVPFAGAVPFVGGVPLAQSVDRTDEYVTENDRQYGRSGSGEVDEDIPPVETKGPHSNLALLPPLKIHFPGVARPRSIFVASP